MNIYKGRQFEEFDYFIKGDNVSEERFFLLQKGGNINFS